MYINIIKSLKDFIKWFSYKKIQKLEKGKKYGEFNGKICRINDQHIFTTKSIIGLLGDLGIDFYNNCLSKHSSFFYDHPPYYKFWFHPILFTKYNYFLFKFLSLAFYIIYKDIIKKIDFLYVSFNPFLVHFFSYTNKKIILHLGFRWEGNKDITKFNLKMLKGALKKDNIVVLSTNKYDQKYFEYFFGYTPPIIPHVVDYINTTYQENSNTRNSKFLIGPKQPYLGGKKITEEISKYLLNYDMIANGLVNEFPNGYEYSKLCSYQGIIVVPYTVYTGAICEYISCGIPLFVPSVDLLVKRHLNEYVLVERKYTSKKLHKSLLTKADNELPLFDPNDDFSYDSLQYRLSFCDRYSYPIIQFDSYEDLLNKIKKTNLEEYSKNLLDFYNKQVKTSKSDRSNIISSL